MTQNPPSAAFLDDLRALLGPSGWRDGADAAPYLVEPRGRWRGHAALVARPADTGAVAEVVRRCAAARVGVIPYGGGTGLVGGQVMERGPAPIVLSLERMNAIRRIDPAEGAMIVEAGAILAQVRAAAEGADRLFPLALASEGSARIGGLLATNAGGVNVLRYGNARDLTLGVEAVLADGSVLHGLKTLRKDNTGYDLRHLLIGSEGTLGVITAAALKLHPRPRETATAFCATPSPQAACDLLPRLRDRLGETISAFELLSAQGMAFLAEHLPEVPRPPVQGAWFVLVEVGAGRESGVAAALEAGLAEGFEAGLVTDAALAQSQAQAQAFWRIREDTPEANRRVGAVASHDVSLPLAALPRFIETAAAAVARIDPGLRINCFGHIGDGNLHFNLSRPLAMADEEFRALEPAINRLVFDRVEALGGSISAEHGIGQLRVAELAARGDPVKLELLYRIKQALDPDGLLNPGKLIELRGRVAAE